MSQKTRKRKPKTKKISFKDKNWFTVIAPKSFNFREIGEVIGFQNNILGRTVEILLYDITHDYTDISLKLKFKIIDLNPEGNTCNSIFWGHQYTNDYIRSLIGRGSSKVQVILNLSTKDKWIFRLTTICTTIRRARSSQQVIIRKIISEILKEFAQNLNHEKFSNGIIYHEFENQITRVAKTIYPLSNCTIVKSKIVSIPEGGEDKIYVPKEEDFEIVEVEVPRSRKSEIRRTERINVKKYAHAKASKDSENDSSDQKE